MKVKGFTLIELLAVIVILAIIALIATPIILNIIGSSKDNATLRSGELYLKAVEQAVARENLKGEFNPNTCEIQSDGNLMCGDKTLVVETEGTRPIEGTINFQKGKITTVEGMLLDGYVLNKESNKNLVVQGKLSDITPQGTYLMISSRVTSSDTYFLGQEQIKRNQVESITIKNRKTVPSNAIYSWDVSEAKDSSVMAWYIDSNNNGLYELYIGGDGGVKANPDSSYLFRSFDETTTIDVTYLNTSDVTNMYCMFSGNEIINIIGLNKWNTGKVTNMSGTFQSIKKIISLDLSSFDTSNVTNMSYMFSGCSNLTTINFGNNFNTSKVIDMTSMFSFCTSMKQLDLSRFDTSQVTIMLSMFNYCTNLTTLDVSKFNTSKVTNMTMMFMSCSSLTNLDLSNFDTSKVKTISYMFNGCNKLKTINLKNAEFKSDIVYETSTPNGTIYPFTNTSLLESIIVKDEASKTFIEKVLTEGGNTGVTVTIAV